MCNLNSLIVTEHCIDNDFTLIKAWIQMNQLSLSVVFTEENDEFTLWISACDTWDNNNLTRLELFRNESAVHQVRRVANHKGIHRWKNQTMIHLSNTFDITGNGHSSNFLRCNSEVVSAEWFIVDADVEAIITDENIDCEIIAALDLISDLSREVRFIFVFAPSAVDKRSSRNFPIKIDEQQQRNVWASRFSAIKRNGELLTVKRCLAGNDENMSGSGRVTQKRQKVQHFSFLAMLAHSSKYREKLTTRIALSSQQVRNLSGTTSHMFTSEC